MIMTYGAVQLEDLLVNTERFNARSSQQISLAILCMQVLMTDMIRGGVIHNCRQGMTIAVTVPAVWCLASQALAICKKSSI